ncbi:MAG: amino acid ABC transporter permease [Lachnospiraceae bacterium]|nr:amino acid ABC transporter permease [Lachnospiraceae bacterium]
MENIKGSISILTNSAVLIYLMKGVAFTLVISVTAVLFGLVIGSVLALLRNYCNKGLARGLKWLATAYIEIFRNTPLLLWIFVCMIFCPCPGFLEQKMFGLSSAEVKLLFKTVVALVLFTSSVIAEIVRGGLNSVAHGQFEAGRSQGFNTVQIMWHIILPQAYNNIIPTLLSQVITTVKDSSYLANVATIELMARTKKLLSSAHRYNGLNTVNVSDVFVLFGFACLIYFVINFTLSCVVRSIKNRRLKKARQAQLARTLETANGT